MSLITLQDFMDNYCVKNGMEANADNVNKSPIKLKKEIDEINNVLTSTKSSNQVLKTPNALSVNNKVLSIFKGDDSVESVSFDLFDTKVNKITSVNNTIPVFDGVQGELKSSTSSIDASGNLTVSGKITSSTGVLIGNSTSATKLQNPITIAGVSFDGSSNINIPFSGLSSKPTTLSGYGITDAYTKTQTDSAVNTAITNLVNLAPAALDTLGEISTQLANDESTISALTNVVSGKQAALVSGTNIKTINGASVLGSGDIVTTQTTITGNAGTATKLQTARTISLSGDLSGSISFDGSSNVSIDAAVLDDSHTHDTRYYTKTDSDNNFLSKTGGTITGETGFNSAVHITGTLNTNGGLSQDGFTVLSGYDTWLRTKDNTGWKNVTYDGGMYMPDANTVSVYGGKEFKVDSNARIGGNTHISGGLIVGEGANTSSLITMIDSDNGNRQILCDANRIGFLKQDGSWGAWCNDDGSFETSSNMTASHFIGGRHIGYTVGSNQWGTGGFEARGEVSLYPTIGFTHYATAGGTTPNFAGSIQLRSTDEFSIYGSDNTSYANINANLFRGSTTTTHADLAEKYETDEEYQIGTVLEIGGSKEVTVFNDGALAGVVSENPGMMLNDKVNGQFIALKGKVPVKCKENITKGQYCIAISGGTVIGKDKKDLTFEDSLNLVGVALEDSKDNLVMTKV